MANRKTLRTRLNPAAWMNGEFKMLKLTDQQYEELSPIVEKVIQVIRENTE